jgi:hypothetical protein
VRGPEILARADNSVAPVRELDFEHRGWHTGPIRGSLSAMLPAPAKRVRWLAIAAALMGSLACGGKVLDAPAGPGPQAARPLPPPVAAIPPPRAPAPSPALPARPPVPARPPAPTEGLRESECACISDSVENVLVANCGQCHGPLAPVAGSGGINFIDDLDRLIAAGLLVPLNSAASPIVIAMVNGTMPPPQSGLPPATGADIAIVAGYLDNPRFWPGWEPAPTDAGSGPSLSDGGSSHGDAGADAP